MQDNQTNTSVAKVFIDQDCNVLVLSDKNIRIKSPVQRIQPKKIEVFTTETICYPVLDACTKTTLSFYCQEFKTAAIPTNMAADTVTLICEQKCQLNTNLDINQFELIAGEFYFSGSIVASEEINIVCQTARLKGQLLRQGKISIFSQFQERSKN